MRRNGLILIVEDNSADRELIQMCLRTAGVTADVRLLADGAEAIAYLKGEGVYANREKHPFPTLIITDLKMPLADGFAVLDFLRTRGKAAMIPTIVFSGSSDPDDVRTAYALGASSYITKPPTTDALCRCLRCIFDYWSLCELPPRSASGEEIKTDSSGKLGERFSRAPFSSPPRDEAR